MAEASTNNNNSTAVVVRRSLNDLPDQILLHIISFLPTNQDTALTSYVSRKWRNLWPSTPSLNFSSWTFCSAMNFFDIKTYYQRFAGFVDRTLILRDSRSPLLTLTLKFTYPDVRFISQINSWIRYAIAHNVQNLDVDLTLVCFDHSGIIVSDFEFSLSLLKDSQVKVLKLAHCNLTCMHIPENMRFFFLGSVSLVGVLLTDKMVVDLMAACVNLDVLVLHTLRGCKDIKICSSKLSELWLQDLYCHDGSLEIVAQNLHLLKIQYFCVRNYALKDASLLTEAVVDLPEYRYWIKVMRLLGHVEHLYCDSCFEELPDLKDFCPERFILQNLKYMELHVWYLKGDLTGMALLLAISPNLQTMVLTSGEMFVEDISEDFIKQLNFKIPSLRHVKIEPFRGEKSEINLLSGLLKAAVVLERIELIPPKVRKNPTTPTIVLDV